MSDGVEFIYTGLRPPPPAHRDYALASRSSFSTLGGEN